MWCKWLDQLHMFMIRHTIRPVLAETYHTSRLVPGSKGFVPASRSVYQKVPARHSVSQHSPTPGTQARNQGGVRRAKPSLENFSPPLEKCAGHSLKVLVIGQKFWAPLRKPFPPPWGPKLVTGLLVHLLLLR